MTPINGLGTIDWVMLVFAEPVAVRGSRTSTISSARSEICLKDLAFNLVAAVLVEIVAVVDRAVHAVNPCRPKFELI